MIRSMFPDADADFFYFFCRQINVMKILNNTCTSFKVIFELVSLVASTFEGPRFVDT